MLLDQLRKYPKAKDFLRRKLQGMGLDTSDWMRIEMYRSSFAHIRSLGPENLDVLEISGGVQWRREFDFKSYKSADYPDFDVCSQTLPQQYDLIIADQVFEHLKFPHQAAQNVFQMLRPGGTFIIATPFLIRVHASPIDCSRWTETGMSYLLQGPGLPKTRSRPTRGAIAPASGRISGNGPRQALLPL